jgi:hypothetical protein
MTILPEPTLDLPFPNRGRVATWLSRNRFGLAVFGLTWLVLLLWWAAFYPGLFSPDSIDYLWQVSTGHWDTHHSVLYQALVWISLYSTGGLAALTLAQTAATAAGLGFAATALRRIGVPAWLLLPVAVGLVTLPTIGEFVVCVWKDVGFAIAVIFAFGTFARLTELRLRRQRVPMRLVVILAAELAVIALMRPNGFVTVAAVGLLGLLVCSGVRLKVLGAAAVAVAISLAANFAVFPALGIRNALTDAVSYNTYADISVLYAEHPQDFAAADLDLMRTAGPLDAWRTGATCVNSDPLLTESGWSLDAANQHGPDFTALWLRLLRSDPGAVLDARLCRAGVIWKPWATGPNDWLSGPPITGYSSFISPTARQSPFIDAVYLAPLSNPLHLDAAKWSRQFDSPAALQAVAWRGSLWSYLTYLAVALALIRRRRIELLMIGVVTAASQLSLLPETPGPSARYMFPSLMIGALALPLAFVGRLPDAEPNDEMATVALDPTVAPDPTVALDPSLALDPTVPLPPTPPQARFTDRG